MEKIDWDTEEGVTEGVIPIRFFVEDAPVIVSRATESVKEEPIENALVMIFKAQPTGDSVLVNKAYQQLTVDNKSVNIYLDAAPGQSIYALCNLAEAEVELLMKKAAIGTYTLNDLYQEATVTKLPDGAYTGKYIMTGGMPMDLVAGKLKKEYVVPIKRLTAQLNFQILFDPTDKNDHFALGEIYIHQIPMGSMLFDGGGTTTDVTSWGYHHPTAGEEIKDSLAICQKDYAFVKQDATHTRSSFYYKDKKNNTGLWLDYTIHKAPTGGGFDSYSASFQMFENRQGRVYDHVDNWTALKGLINRPDVTHQYPDMYRRYQQVMKRELASVFDRTSAPNSGLYNTGDKGFQYATYLTIRGVYTRKNAVTGSDPIDVTYYVYLGSDNYRDFNICRNHFYSYQIRILDVDQTDTRVDATPIGEMTLFGNFDRILDAHPDVMQVLMYSPRDWKISVKNPDETPWLELSHSPVYRPRKAGESSEGRASYQLSGKAGLHYFYIHADEYIPYVKAPKDNDSCQVRTGWIVCNNGTGLIQELPVKQYPAQMVICHINYDIHTMKEVRDTFYVERILEKKNLSWGFLNYWSFIMDDLIAAGQWDGLANTRRMYQTALNGDKWGVKPAYPVDKYPDGIPGDTGLGYAVHKNRDRNGNGKIDYNEIVWYWPAANELQALSGHINGGSKYYDAENAKHVQVDWRDEPGHFHSSSPSSADPAGITPGFCYSVLLSPNVDKSGKKSIVMRSRFYNVICARRYHAWMGPDGGSQEGGIHTDGSWGGDDEIIIDK